MIYSNFPLYKDHKFWVYNINYINKFLDFLSHEQIKLKDFWKNFGFLIDGEWLYLAQNADGQIEFFLNRPLLLDEMWTTAHIDEIWCNPNLAKFNILLESDYVYSCYYRTQKKVLEPAFYN